MIAIRNLFRQEGAAMTKDVEELDLVSAIWILASNDDNPIITYEGIWYRLGLPPETDVRAIIKRRRELFRLGVSASRFDEWQEQLLSGKGLPVWIVDEYPSPEQRAKVIRELSKDDVFRSQFRANKNAEKSPIEIINWGLEHLDRLRKAQLESRNENATKKQMKQVLWLGVAGIIVQIVVAYFKK